MNQRLTVNQRSTTNNFGFSAAFYALEVPVSRLGEIDFSKPATHVQSLDAMAFTTDRERQPFWDGGVDDNFAARISGDLHIETAGRYTFYLTSDDGSSLAIGDNLVIDNDGLHSSREQAVTLELAAGTHAIEVLYFERSGGQVLTLEWHGPDTNGQRALLGPQHVTHQTDAGDQDAGQGDDTHQVDSTDRSDSSRGLGDDGVDAVDGSVDHGGDDSHPHGPRLETGADHGSGHDHHHSQMLEIVPLEDVTHMAVRDGSWFDPDTWMGGEVPGVGANVLVGHGLTVTYDGVSGAAISTIRVDGALHFASDTDTALSVDTIVVNDGGHFTMGAPNAPVTANAVITFVNSDQTLDAEQIGLGLVALPGATTEVYGTGKTTRVAVDGNQMAGDAMIEVKGGVPADWQVGDVLVLAGTQIDRRGDVDANTMFQDEVLQITAITPLGIEFVNLDTGAAALRFDHQTPEGFADQLDIHMVNLSRSVVFQSEQGSDTPLMDRGHIMVHDHASVFQNAALIGLGRTDKARVLDPFDTSLDVNGTIVTVEGEGTNLPGRYPLHVHRAFDHGDDGGAVDFSGNAVWDAPGWGIVLHGSRGYLDNNVVFDTVGAGIVSEDGDEVGYFRDNTVIKVASGTTGNDFPGDIVRLGAADTNDTSANPREMPVDFGFHGSGFWFDTGFSVREATGNVTASTAHSGMFFYGHNDGEFGRLVDPATAPSDTHRYIQDGLIDPFHVPVGVIEENQLYNSTYGMFLAGLTRDDFRMGWIEHMDQSEFRDIEMWGIDASGIFTAYATNFIFKDLLILGDLNDPNNGYDARGHDAGILIHKVNHNVEMHGIHVEGFHTGVDVGQGGGQGYHDVDPFDPFIFADLTLFNNLQNFTPSAGRTGNSPGDNQMMDNPPFNPYAQLTGTLNVDSSASKFAPVPVATATQIAENRYWLDAANSYDPDYEQDAQIAGKETIENSIAFFQWDIDGDGLYDAFGRDLAVDYERGTVPDAITLTITDAQGAQSTTSVNLDRGVGVSREMVVDGGFDGELAPRLHQTANRIETGPYLAHWGQGTTFGDDVHWDASSGFAEFVNFGTDASEQTNRDGTLHQIITNRSEHQGEDYFEFDLAYTKGDTSVDGLTVQIWGIRGLPSLRSWREPLPLYYLEDFDTKLIYQRDDFLDNGSFEWTGFRDKVYFGNGYDYIYILFTAESIDIGDWLAIDNVSIGGFV